MQKNINDLREKLFTTIDMVAKKEIDIKDANMIALLAQTIINSAKAEIDYMKLSGDEKTSFFEKSNMLPSGITGRTVHRIK